MAREMARDEGGSHTAEPIGRDMADRTGRPDRSDEQRLVVKPAKTSAAAVFALVFGLSALLAVLTILLAPLAIVLSLIGIVLAVVAFRMTSRVGVTGKGVAVGGLALSLIALLLAITAAVGITTFLNNQGAVDRLNKQVQQMQDKLPKKVEIPTP